METRKMQFWACLWVAFFIISFTSCEEDHDTSKNDEIYGSWKISLLMTDNENLNKTLPTLLPLAGINLSEATVLFNTDANVKISVPATGGAIDKESRYNFDGKQLALTLEDIGGIPVNAFEVPSYTSQEMTLFRTISPLEMKVLMAVLKDKNETVAALLESLFGDSLTNGLTLTVKLAKSGDL